MNKPVDWTLRDELFETIADFTSDDKKGHEIDGYDRLGELGIDELVRWDLVLRLEEIFDGLEISIKVANEWEIVNDICDTVEEHLCLEV